MYFDHQGIFHGIYRIPWVVNKITNNITHKTRFFMERLGLNSCVLILRVELCGYNFVQEKEDFCNALNA